MTSTEFDARNTLDVVPNFLSVTQVAVLNAINSGRFTTATRVGESWAIAQSEVERRKA